MILLVGIEAQTLAGPCEGTLYTSVQVHRRGRGVLSPTSPWLSGSWAEVILEKQRSQFLWAQLRLLRFPFLFLLLPFSHLPWSDQHVGHPCLLPSSPKVSSPAFPSHATTLPFLTGLPQLRPVPSQVGQLRKPT